MDVPQRVMCSIATQSGLQNYFQVLLVRGEILDELLTLVAQCADGYQYRGRYVQDLPLLIELIQLLREHCAIPSLDELLFLIPIGLDNGGDDAERVEVDLEVPLGEGGVQDLLQDVHTLVLDELRLEEVVRVDNQVEK